MFAASQWRCKKRLRGLTCRSRPRRRQLGGLATLDAQGFGDRVACRAQLRTVAVQRPKIEAVLTVELVTDLRRARSQFGMRVPECVASPYVGLGVLDGGAALSQSLGDIEAVGHPQAIRAAAYSSASA